MLDAPAHRPAPTAGLIGPNAILQLEGPVATLLGPDVLPQILHMCDVPMPTGDAMIPQEDVARVHRTLHRLFPRHARDIAIASGAATARYIRANRIPGMARQMLRLLPVRTAQRLLTRAILAHAWTFCGTGSLRADIGPEAVHLSLLANPLVDPASGEPLQCHWHAAVFRTLYTELLGTPHQTVETDCCGAGAPACHFVITRDT